MKEVYEHSQGIFLSVVGRLDLMWVCTYTLSVIIVRGGKKAFGGNSVFFQSLRYRQSYAGILGMQLRRLF